MIWFEFTIALDQSDQIGKKSLRMLRKNQNIDTDFRESKTPRDNIQKLNAWDIVKEKDMRTLQNNNKETISKFYYSKSYRSSIGNSGWRRRS